MIGASKIIASLYPKKESMPSNNAGIRSLFKSASEINKKIPFNVLKFLISSEEKKEIVACEKD